MNIKVVTAAGKAKTLLGSFDAALLEAGIANMNLITLSSVIPSNSVISIEKPKINEKDFGKKLYVVIARRETDAEETIAAGVGWVMEKHGRFGLFVEHDGGSKEEVEALIKSTLTGMVASRDEYEFTDIKFAISEETNKSNECSCVISVAVYEIDEWHD